MHLTFVEYHQTLKNKCRLDVGSTFIFKGQHCTVSQLRLSFFKYTVQEGQPRERVMHYWFYLTTNSAKSRKCI